MTDARRRVFLDLEGNESGTVFVVVAAPTGVVYEVPGGGYGCVRYEQEGCLCSPCRAGPSTGCRPARLRFREPARPVRVC
jgi:hypothetical protein